MTSKLFGGQSLVQKGLTVVEIINAVSEKKITGMNVMGENPAMSEHD